MGTQTSFFSMLPELGMRDFWEVYDSHFVEVTLSLFERARLMPGFGRALPTLSEAELVDRSRKWQPVVRTAILDGDWRPMLAIRRLQGRQYARYGVRFSEWLDLFAHFQSLMVALLAESLADDHARLSRAVMASIRYIHRTTNTIAEAYIGAQSERARFGAQEIRSERWN